MAASGSAARKSMRDKERAAELKRLKIERTTGRCAVCGAFITVDSVKSRYRHACWRERTT